ncbi:Clp protease ClpS [Cellulomonas carbonis T26]|uniref:ATP-dependent Clp protease adapter protein ClpS n=2 Tax=Cellulomonas carbonis TaxID=1386092 RepID=A0A0A0BRI4_9CELL|nr:Clp protease ClpS [Cellulomonas carbonis T26]
MVRTIFAVPGRAARTRRVLEPYRLLAPADRREGPGPGLHALPPPADVRRPAVRVSAPSTGTMPAQDVASAPVPLGDGWTTVVWNDPVNLMSYVTYVFRSYFGYTAERAHRLMLQVHTEGRATVSRGNREQMEIDVQAMHGFGLWATVQPADG